jgi:hypothetical protein
MKRKTALHFSNELQSVLDDLIKDFVFVDGKKLLRVVIPKEWKGRAAAFDIYMKKGNRQYGFKVDSFHPSMETNLLYHSYEDGVMYFSIKPPAPKFELSY